MSRGKHAPSRLFSYWRVHETIIQQFLRGGFVTSEDLSFVALGGHLVIEGRIACLGSIHIDVSKRIHVLSGHGGSAMVQTAAYSYNVAAGRLGNLFRYDSPHDDHNPEHHVHRYDVLCGDMEGSVEFIYDDEQRPTLSEVIAEAELWYHDNREALARSMREYGR